MALQKAALYKGHGCALGVQGQGTHSQQMTQLTPFLVQKKTDTYMPHCLLSPSRARTHTHTHTLGGRGREGWWPSWSLG